MTREEAIAIIENEKKCVNRANKNDYCNRDCYNCELVKTDTEILEAFDMAIKALEQQSCENYTSIPLMKCDEDIAKAFQFGMALGFGEKHDEMDKVIEEVKKSCHTTAEDRALDNET